MASPFSSMPSEFSSSSSDFSVSADDSSDPGAAFSLPATSVPPHFGRGSFSVDPTAVNPFTYPSTCAVPRFSSGNVTADNPFRYSPSSAASQSSSALFPAGNTTAGNPFFRDPLIPAASGFISDSFRSSATACNPFRYPLIHPASDFSSGSVPAGYATSGYPSKDFISLERKSPSSSTVRFGSSPFPSSPFSNSPSNAASSFATPYMASATTKPAISSARTSAAAAKNPVAYATAKLMTSETTMSAASSDPKPTTTATSYTTSENARIASATTTTQTLSPTSASATPSTAASKTPPNFFAALHAARSSFAAHPTKMPIDQAHQLMTRLIDLMARGTSALALDPDAVTEMDSVVCTLLSASLPSSFVGHLGFLENSLTDFVGLPTKLKLASDDMCSKQSEVESLIPKLKIFDEDFRAMETKEVDIDSTIRVTAQEVKDLEERLMAAKDKLRSLQSRRATVVSDKSDCLAEGQELQKELLKALSAEAAAVRRFNYVKRRQEMADAQWQIIVEGLQASLLQLC